MATFFHVKTLVIATIAYPAWIILLLLCYIYFRDRNRRL